MSAELIPTVESELTCTDDDPARVGGPKWQSWKGKSVLGGLLSVVVLLAVSMNINHVSLAGPPLLQGNTSQSMMKVKPPYACISMDGTYCLDDTNAENMDRDCCIKGYYFPTGTKKARFEDYSECGSKGYLSSHVYSRWGQNNKDAPGKCHGRLRLRCRKEQSHCTMEEAAEGPALCEGWTMYTKTMVTSGIKDMKETSVHDALETCRKTTGCVAIGVGCHECFKMAITDGAVKVKHHSWSWCVHPDHKPKGWSKFPEAYQDSGRR